MFAAKVFLGIVGGAYLLLAAWCGLQPSRTAEAIGYRLSPGSGQSEYFTVYLGLQLGLGLAWLAPIFQENWLVPILAVCTLLHASLILARLTSILLYPGLSGMTYAFAGLEFLLAVVSGLILRSVSS